MSKVTKSAEIALVKQLIAGSQKHFPNASQPLPVGGTSLTVAQATQTLQGFADAGDAVGAAKAVLQAKLVAQRTQTPTQTAFVNAYESIVRGMFGNAADVLADFGLAPHKARVPMTAEQKAVAAAKRAATRAARHTMGKNQKKEVKGAVSAALVVTPSNGSPPVATPPAPAPAAPNGTTAHA